MAKTAAPAAPGAPKKKRFARVRQLWQVFGMTRRADPLVVWLMLIAFAGTLAAFLLVSLVWDQVVYLAVLGTITGIMVALIVMARRAERAAYSQIAGQPGATGAAMRGLRRGWNTEEQPVAVDPRTQDMVFRSVGRPGVVLVTEGPLPRVKRLADGERKRVTRLVPNVPVVVLHAGDGEDQVPLRKLSSRMTRMKPALSKTQVSEVSKRLTALGAIRMPVPKGVDPLRARPDRRAMRGR